MDAYNFIIDLLRENGIDHRIIEHAPAGTVEEAVAAGFDVNTMLKTVVFRAKGEPARYFLCALRDGRCGLQEARHCNRYSPRQSGAA